MAEYIDGKAVTYEIMYQLLSVPVKTFRARKQADRYLAKCRAAARRGGDQQNIYIVARDDEGKPVDSY